MARIKRERKLPVQQLAILSICRFAEPLASTSLYPYLPEMVQSFGVPQNEVGKWAGICAATFSLCQAVMGIPWGMFSDTYGRKYAILLGLTCTMCTSLLWGFSTSLAMAITARALAGAGNGNVGIIRTTVAEMVPFPELQPRAFSIMPLVWNIGSIFGPTIGGALANPLRLEPGQRGQGSGIFEMFPYSLPNIVSACFFLTGITVGTLFLEETLETWRGRRDWGLVLGDKIKQVLQSVFDRKSAAARAKNEDRSHGETEPLLKPANHVDEVTFQPSQKRTTPSFKEVLTKQAVINLVVYTLLAMHSMAFDQLLPVYMQHKPIGGKGSTPYTPPLKFAGGFGMKSWEIGLLNTCYGIAGMFVQFFVFPPLCRRYGVLFWLKVVSCVFPVAYLAIPFTALIPDQKVQVGCAFVVMLLKCLCGIFAFPCSTILLTNAASSLRTLGTLNGFATSFSAIGRAAGPALGGTMFTIGVKRGYVIAPWWFLAAVAIVSAIPVFWLVEGEGFGGDGEVSDEEDDEADEEIHEDVVGAAALEGGAEAAGKPGPLPVPLSSHADADDPDEHQEEHEYGGLAPLTRTNTAASSGVATDDGHDPTRDTGASQTQNETEDPPRLSRRNSRRMVRKMSIPIGLGNQGISRRYSSNLAQSFGSSGSYHEH